MQVKPRWIKDRVGVIGNDPIYKIVLSDSQHVSGLTAGEADEALRRLNTFDELLAIAQQVVDGYEALDFDLQSVAREAVAAIAKAEGETK